MEFFLIQNGFSTCEEKESPQLGPQKGRKEMPFPAMIALVRIFAVLGPAVAASIGASVVTVKNDNGVEVVESIHAIQLKERRIAMAKEELQEELNVTIGEHRALLAWVSSFDDEDDVSVGLAERIAELRRRELELCEELDVPVEEFHRTQGAMRTTAMIAQLRERAAAG